MKLSKHPLVETESGYVAGIRRTWRDVHGGTHQSAAFLGIPFAAPPTGRLRFAAPQPVKPWDETLDATVYGATPLRHTVPEAGIPEPAFAGESTLNVNVFSANLDADARQPVLVYIHGGGYSMGSPSGPWFDGRTFNRSGIVVVALSYRLGFEGFGWVYGAPHNRGLLDQIAALRWVQRNIARFGGDPGAVTIAGQSAGGGSVLALVLSPLTRGLFQRAVVHSGALPERTLEDVERHGRAFAEHLGVDPTLEACSRLDSETIWRAQQTWREVLARRAASSSLTDRLRHLLEHGVDDLIGPFAPSIDGVVTTGTMRECVARGQGAHIAVLSGCTLHEFTGPEEDLDGRAPLEVLIAAGLDRDTAAAYLAEHDDLTPDLQIGQVTTDVVFRGPLHAWTLARNATSAGARTWAYTFGWRGPQGLSLHCMDLPFVFDVLDEPVWVPRMLGDRAPQPLADAMHSAWARFIRDGDPGWVPALAGEGMTFDVTCSVEPIDHGESLLSRR